jgi:hypothetical protein
MTVKRLLNIPWAQVEHKKEEKPKKFHIKSFVALTVIFTG